MGGDEWKEYGKAQRKETEEVNNVFLFIRNKFICLYNYIIYTYITTIL